MPRTNQYCLKCRQRNSCIEICDRLKRYLEPDKSKKITQEDKIYYFFLVLQRANLKKSDIIKIIKLLNYYADSHLYKLAKDSINKPDLIELFLSPDSFQEIDKDDQFWSCI